MEAVSRNVPSSHNSDVSGDSETRLPFSSSIASTLHANKAQTLASATEVTPHTTERTVDSVDRLGRTGADWSTETGCLQNGSVEPSVGVCCHGDSDVMQSQRRAAENFVAQWTDDSRLQPAPVSAADVGWYYCDPQGHIQGDHLSLSLSLCLCVSSPYP